MVHKRQRKYFAAKPAWRNSLLTSTRAFHKCKSERASDQLIRKLILVSERLPLYLGKRTLIDMTTETRRDVFQAIADPTRRKIIDLISHRPMNLRTIADYFHISRPAISQQIKILNECGLVEITKEGRETFCSIQPRELKKIADWAGRYSKLWEERIDSFEAYVNKLHAKKNKRHGKSK